MIDKNFRLLLNRLLTAFEVTGSSVLRRKVMGGKAAHDLPPLKVPECSVISSGARDLYLCIHKLVIGSPHPIYSAQGVYGSFKEAANKRDSSFREATFGKTALYNRGGIGTGAAAPHLFQFPYPLTPPVIPNKVRNLYLCIHKFVIGNGARSLFIYPIVHIYSKH
jgi:hypothetical protein